MNVAWWSRAGAMTARERTNVGVAATVSPASPAALQVAEDSAAASEPAAATLVTLEQPQMESVATATANK
jgi:RES domain-containing protein